MTNWNEVKFKSFSIEHLQDDWFLIQSDPKLIPYPGMVIALPNGTSLEIYNAIVEGDVSRV